MRVVIDTNVWSLVLRRRRSDLSQAEERLVKNVAALIQQEEAVLLGSIRQEVLSGIRDPALFEQVRAALRRFPDEPITTVDFERAAQFSNICRGGGVACSPIDALVCAKAVGMNAEILTLDGDFQRYESLLPLKLSKT